MKVTGSKAMLLKRIKSAHRKSRFVGTIYLLANIALVVLACLPLLSSAEGSLSVITLESGFALGTFYQPIVDVINGTETLSGGFLIEFIPAVVYILMLVILLVNMIRSFSQLKMLYTRKASRTLGYNRNMFAMDELGKLFASSFATVVILNFENAMLFTGGEVTLYGWIGLAFCLFVHFFCGVIGGKVSLFEVLNADENAARSYHLDCGQFFNGVVKISDVAGPAKVKELKRIPAMGVYFFRNLFQIVATGAMIWAFAKVNILNYALEDLLGVGWPENLGTSIVPMALEVGLLLCLFILIKHATAQTEFNRLGMDGRGMRNFKVFSLFYFFIAVGFTVFLFLNDPQLNYMATLPMVGVSLVAFWLDVIIHSRADNTEKVKKSKKRYGVFFNDMEDATYDDVAKREELSL